MKSIQKLYNPFTHMYEVIDHKGMVASFRSREDMMLYFDDKMIMCD